MLGRFFLRRFLFDDGKRRISSLPRAEESFNDDDETLTKLSKDRGKNIHLINRIRHKQLGPAYLERVGPDVDALWIADPKLTEKVFLNEGPYPIHFVPEAWRVYNEIRNRKRGLFFLDGPEWWKMRQILNPMLLKKDPFLSFEPLIRAEAERVIEEWRDKGKIENLEGSLHRWSINTILRILFGDEFEFPEIVDFIRAVQTTFEQSAELQLLSARESALNQTSEWTKFAEAADKTFDYINKLRDSSKKQKKLGLVGLLEKSGLDDEYIGRIAADFIIAAADTTSVTTLWTLSLLSSDLESQKKALEGGPRFIRWCNKESMRLFPVAPFITRIMPRETDFGDFVVSEGQLILISTFAMSRDENYFADPDRFIPERWDRRRNDKLNKFTSLPFGHRIRSCIGKKLAEFQMTFFIQRVLQEFVMSSNGDDKIQMTMRLIGVPDRKIDINIKPRTE